MIRTAALAVALILLGHVPARSQSSTAQGVDAFLRGDYQRAAEVLKPIAERSRVPDAIAAFFMAAMYDAGLGVGADSIRACALYMMATSDRGPIGAHASEVVRSRAASIGDEAFRECNWLANFGWDHGFDHETFVLGAGHWITLNLREAAIFYDGSEKRQTLPIIPRLALVLPPRYTELAAGPTRSTRRHFIEMLMWQPMRGPQAWGLMWILNEVVRDQMIRVASEQLATIVAAEPPADESARARARVQLRVRDDGHVEWTVIDGTHPRSAVVATEVDRREEELDRQRAQARAVAERAIDWGRTFDVHRPPSLTYPDARACGRNLVYGWSADHAEAITVALRTALRTPGTQRFDLSRPDSGVEVGVRLTERPEREFPLCSDVVVPAVVEKWRTTKGTVTFDVSPRAVGGRFSRYQATIRIEGAEFVSAGGVRVSQAQPIVLTVFGQ